VLKRGRSCFLFSRFLAGPSKAVNGLCPALYHFTTPAPGQQGNNIRIMNEQQNQTALELLQVPIQTLEFSEEFKQTMKMLGFTNLGQVNAQRTEELEKMEGFNTLLIHEYVSFLVRHELGDLIDH
jgi:hypothetical protein